MHTSWTIVQHCRTRTDTDTATVSRESIRVLSYCLTTLRDSNLSQRALYGPLNYKGPTTMCRHVIVFYRGAKVEHNLYILCALCSVLQTDLYWEKGNPQHNLKVAHIPKGTEHVPLVY